MGDQSIKWAKMTMGGSIKMDENDNGRSINKMGKNDNGRINQDG
jgi:hypothetical protein